MPREFKGAEPRGQAPAKPAKRGLNPLFLGIIIGLLLGIGMAVGFAVWLNRENNPFVEKSKPVATLPAITPKSGTPLPAPPAMPSAKSEDKAGEKAGDKAADRPRFDFYQILPGEKQDKPSDRTPDKAPEKKAEPPKSPEPVRPASGPAPKPEVKPASGEVFMLQAGAFQNQSEAENMKAKVAFAGFEAKVAQVNVADKGTLYRVRLGPYKSQEEVNRIKAVLSQSGIAAAVVRGE